MGSAGYQIPKRRGVPRSAEGAGVWAGRRTRAARAESFGRTDCRFAGFCRRDEVQGVKRG